VCADRLAKNRIARASGVFTGTINPAPITRESPLRQSAHRKKPAVGLRRPQILEFKGWGSERRNLIQRTFIGQTSFISGARHGGGSFEPATSSAGARRARKARLVAKYVFFTGCLWGVPVHGSVFIFGQSLPGLPGLIIHTRIAIMNRPDLARGKWREVIFGAPSSSLPRAASLPPSSLPARANQEAGLAPTHRLYGRGSGFWK
jgi:hypothetical protein